MGIGDYPRPMFSRLCFLAFTLLLTAAPFARAVNPIPPPGVPVPDADRAALTAGVAALGKEIDSLRSILKVRPEMLALLPDVMIFHKSVDWALRYDEFFDPKHIDAAKEQLALGMQRAKELRDGKPSWNSATGLVVRGYLSKIDGSVQPYGLVMPDDFKFPDNADIWLPLTPSPMVQAKDARVLGAFGRLTGAGSVPQARMTSCRDGTRVS